MDIKKLREERGWTQFELARESGIQACLISKMEQGKMHIPENYHYSLSIVFGLPPDPNPYWPRDEIVYCIHERSNKVHRMCGSRYPMDSDEMYGLRYPYTYRTLCGSTISTMWKKLDRAGAYKRCKRCDSRAEELRHISKANNDGLVIHD